MFMGKSVVLGNARFVVTIAFVVAAMLQAASAFAGDTVYYYSSDTIHSEVVVTDANRNVVERTYYAPYGQVLNRDLRDGPGYTGHEEDPETGLVYMQQRYYDTEIGRFISTDPVAATDTGGNFNRYEYAKDNPYRYTDPDGRYTCSGSEKECAAVSDFAMTAIVAKMYSNPKSSEYNSVGRAVSELGLPGQQNGVTVTAKSLMPGVNGGAPQGGKIQIDVRQIKSFGSELKEYGRDSSKTISQVQNAVGAGVLMHETTHEVDYMNPNIGYPHSRLADSLLEIHAYSVEKSVGAALGMGEIGLSTQHEFNSKVSGSVNQFCSVPSNCP